MVVGLAGRSCAGKNAVAQILEEKGWETVDMDLMGHEVLDTLSAEAAALFGEEILDGKGGVDRKKLGPLVFSSPEKLKQLEQLVYPEMHRRLDAHLSQRGAVSSLVINAAALEKSDFWKKCDILLWVTASWPIRLFRAWKRDRRSLFNLIRRFRAQKQLNPQYFFKRVDTYTIKNDGTRKGLERRIDRWLEHLPPE